MSAGVPTQVVTILAHFIRERTGIHHGEKDHELLAHKLEAHAEDAGFPSVLELYYAVRYDDPDGRILDALIDALVVNETYFFREQRSLEVWLAPLITRARAGERLRIWSAACATGEEPISIAVMLAQAGVRESFEIVATDISPRALERARRGDYGRRAHRVVPAGVPPWIVVTEGRSTVDEKLRRDIYWKRVNLTDPASVAVLGTFDAIVCRNVLIYFDDETIQAVVGSLGKALRPQGELLLAASESLLRFGTLFTCQERDGVFLYRRGER
jgi:chemotaxis protein methyltransferase CheR